MILWFIIGIKKYGKLNKYTDLKPKYKRLELLDGYIKSYPYDFGRNVTMKFRLESNGNDSLIYSVMKECNIEYLEASKIVCKDIQGTREEHLKEFIKEYLNSKGAK